MLENTNSAGQQSLSTQAEVSSSFGRDVREVRRALQLPEQVFAQRVQIPLASLQQLESGAGTSSPVVCQRVRGFLKQVLALQMMNKMQRLHTGGKVRLSDNRLHWQLFGEGRMDKSKLN